jgi:peptide/nickel transport system substrate-binding protein
MPFNRRQFMGGTAAAVVGTTLAGSYAGPAFAQSTDTLKTGFGARGLRTIDPHKSIQGVDNWAIIHIYDKLVDLPMWHFPKTLDELVPRLATSWSQTPDSKSFTFKLRQGVKFQKGYGEMTSEDVKFTFDRVRDSDRIGVVRPKFSNITEVVADDPYTVTFKLEQPDPLFPLGVLSDYDGSVMSKKAVADKGEDGIGKDPIGTGPYEMKTLFQDPSQGLLVTAYKDHWGDQPKTPNIQFTYIADTTARTLAILSGSVHMIEGVRAPGWVDSIKQRKSGMFYDVVSPGSFFSMQINLTAKPFDDVRVRQALFYGIDRDQIATAIAPISQRTYGVNPPSFPGGFTKETIPEDVAYKYDPDKAKDLLKQAGFPNGFSFNAYTSQREDYSAIMLMIQDQLRKINVDLKLDIKDHTAFHAEQESGDNTLAQQSSALAPVPTLPFVEWLSADATVKSDGSGGGNYSRYGVAIPGIDDLLKQALAEPDLEKRLKIVQQMDHKVLQDAAYMPVCDNGFLVVRAANVDLGYEVQSGYVNWPLTQAVIKS